MSGTRAAMQQVHPNGLIGSGPHRIEGLLKVTGRAPYGADHPVAGAAHAVLVTLPVASGRIAAIDEADACRVPGVCCILTHRNVGDAVASGRGAPGLQHSGYVSQGHAPLSSPAIRFAGQIIAVVVAETPEIADHAAGLLRFTFEAARRRVVR